MNLDNENPRKPTARSKSDSPSIMSDTNKSAGNSNGERHLKQIELANEPARDSLLSQYQILRDEIQRSIFVQYDVIKVGALLLGSILVFIPAVYSAIGKGAPLSQTASTIAVPLLFLAIISISFIFIMGAGEIRIMRAAAFCNHIMEELVLREHPDLPKSLLWDNFVSDWNRRLATNGPRLFFEERVYLSIPFALIAVLADLSSLGLIVLSMDSSLLWIWGGGVVIQLCMFLILVRLRIALSQETGT